MKRIVFIVACLSASCGSRAGQITLKTGQCVLDTGVEALLLADLADANYAQLVSDAVTKFTPDVVRCALQAIATTPQAGSAAPTTSEAAPIKVRAKEMLDKLGTAK